MLLEERCGANGCSCGVPLVACAMGPTCPACGTVVPEIDISEHHGVLDAFYHPKDRRDRVHRVHENVPSKPKATYYSTNSLIRKALHLHIKNAASDSNRRDRDRSTELDNVCQGLGYPPTVQRFAWFYYTKIRRAERVQNSHGLLAACLYAAARELLSCLSLRDIVVAFNSRSFPVTQRDVTRAYSRFRKHLPNPNVPPERYLFKVMADLSESPRVRRSLAEAGLDIDEAFVDIVCKSRAILLAKRALPGRASIKCAAAVFLAFRQCKVGIGARTFATIVDASEGNLRNVAVALRDRKAREGD